MTSTPAPRATRPTAERATTTHTRQLFQALAIGGIGPVAIGVWSGAASAVTRPR